jgi:hypothetical protein
MEKALHLCRKEFRLQFSLLQIAHIFKTVSICLSETPYRLHVLLLSMYAICTTQLYVRMPGVITIYKRVVFICKFCTQLRVCCMHAWCPCVWGFVDIVPLVLWEFLKPNHVIWKGYSVITRLIALRYRPRAATPINASWVTGRTWRHNSWWC